MPEKKRILSGMRPTGPLHLGNLHGALANWVKMQEQYDCFFFIADWHALTSDYEDTGSISGYIRNMLIDWLSAGLSPEKSTLFIQSHIKEHAELFLILSMITPVPWLERNPTYKDQMVQLSNKDLSTFGFLGYPVVEITREIARRFNYLYGNVFPEPDSILTETPKILGIDRRKMSKSYNNAIYFSDSPDEIAASVSKMLTDPQRARKSDPGNPDVCNVYEFHKFYSDITTVARINQECRTAKIGCVECKKIMAQNLIKALEPMREKREYYEARPQLVHDIIKDGCDKARRVARRTMAEVRAAVNL